MKLTAKIHIEKQNANLSEEEYRMLIAENFCKYSSTELNDTQKLKLITLLKGMQGVYHAQFEKATKPSSKQIALIACLGRDLAWSKRQIDTYITKHFSLGDASWMSCQTARAVIIGLMNIKALKKSSQKSVEKAGKKAGK